MNYIHCLFTAVYLFKFGSSGIYCVFNITESVCRFHDSNLLVTTCNNMFYLVTVKCFNGFITKVIHFLNTPYITRRVCFFIHYAIFL